MRLCSLLCGSDDRIRLAAVQTLGNVLLAEESIAQAQVGKERYLVRGVERKIVFSHLRVSHIKRNIDMLCWRLA